MSLKVDGQQLNTRTRLIRMEMEHKDLAIILHDIRAFEPTVINRLRTEDLERVKTTGFTFTTMGLKNMKEELRSWLFNNPSCLSNSFENILENMKRFGQIAFEMENKLEHEEEKKEALTYRKSQKKETHDEDDEWAIEPTNSDSEEEEKDEGGPEKLWY